MENLSNPIWERSTFTPPVFFKDTIFLMKVNGAN
jgi:hypothetical protein